MTIHDIAQLFSIVPGYLLYHENINDYCTSPIPNIEQNELSKLFEDDFINSLWGENTEKKELYELLALKQVVSFNEFKQIEAFLNIEMNKNPNDRLSKYLSETKNKKYFNFPYQKLMSEIEKKYNYNSIDDIYVFNINRDKEINKLAIFITIFENIYLNFKWDKDFKHFSLKKHENIWVDLSNFENFLIELFGNEYYNHKSIIDFKDFLLKKINYNNYLFDKKEIHIVRKSFVSNLNLIDKQIDKIIFGKKSDNMNESKTTQKIEAKDSTIIIGSELKGVYMKNNMGSEKPKKTSLFGRILKFILSLITIKTQ